jgi:hypothetical protein
MVDGSETPLPARWGFRVAVLGYAWTPGTIEVADLV